MKPKSLLRPVHALFLSCALLIVSGGCTPVPEGCDTPDMKVPRTAQDMCADLAYCASHADATQAEREGHPMSPEGRREIEQKYRAACAKDAKRTQKTLENRYVRTGLCVRVGNFFFLGQ